MSTSASLAPQGKDYGAIPQAIPSAFKIIPSRDEKIKSCVMSFFSSLKKPEYLFLLYASIGTVTALATKEDAMLIYAATGVLIIGAYLFFTRVRSPEESSRTTSLDDPIL